MIDTAICQALNQTIVEVTKNAKYEVMPEMSDRSRNSLLEAINKAVEEGIKQIKN